MLRTMTITTAALVVTLALFAPAANAVLVDVDVDGVVTAGEGYVHTSLGFWVDVTIPVLDADGNPVYKNKNKIETEEVSAFMTGASLWLAQDATGDLSVAFGLDKSFVDNSYGKTSIGWGSDAPSDRKHNFEDLLDSDLARFVFKNGDTSLLDVTLDYLDGSGDKYFADTTSNEFSINAPEDAPKPPKGDPEDDPEDVVLEASTSLAHNWDTFGAASGYFGENSDSPAALGNTADPDYGNPTEPLWVYDVIYEFKIAGSVFDGLVLDLENPRFLLENPGFLTIEEVHASPCKEEGKKLTNFTPLETSQGDLPGAVPEPLTVFGLLAGLGGMAGYIRKRRMA